MLIFGIVFWIIAILVVFWCGFNLNITRIIHLLCIVTVCLETNYFYLFIFSIFQNLSCFNQWIVFHWMYISHLYLFLIEVCWFHKSPKIVLQALDLSDLIPWIYLLLPLFMTLYRFVTLYRSQRSRSSPRKRNAKGQIVIWGGLTNSCEKKQSEK